MSLGPGSRIGVFDIVSKLGEGGMGEVYLAQDTKLNRRVAVKVLLQSGAADPERLARLGREARVFAALNHPNIGSIYGIEEAEGFLALVLEYVDGPTLADLIAQGMTLSDALQLAHQIADALESAHEHGVVHRDLKPANVKVRPDGTVKVLDFGLAKLADPAVASHSNFNVTASPTLSMQATMAGMILGTAAYMSPEQARGRAVDRRTDVWAFGCVLFEMLVGSRAFEGEDVAETIGAVIHKEPDWSRLPPATPATVCLVLRRCLEKDPKRRIRDIGDVQLALGGAFDAPAPTPVQGTAGAKAAPSWRRMLPIAASALLAAGAAAGIAWRMRPATSAAPIIRYAIQLQPDESFSGLNRTMLAISPDGSQLAYLANDRLYVRTLSDFEPRIVAGDPARTDRGQDALGLSGFGARASPAFSPDGRSIAYYSQVDQTLRRVPVSGGTAQVACHTTSALPTGLVWDGDDILFGALRNGIFRCDANGGEVEQLVALKDGELAFAPQWLPGRQVLLFTISTPLNGDTRGEGTEVVSYDVKSGTRRTLVRGATGKYLPTGHLLFAREGALLAAPFDPLRQAVTGPAVVVVESVRRTANTANSGVDGVQMAVSANGTLVYLPGAASNSGGDVAVGVADRTGVTTRLALPPGSYDQIRASPDGKEIVVGTFGGNEGIVSTYDLGAAGQLRRLTFNGRNRFPIWSPDGQRIAFQSDRDGDLAIFVQRADGTGPTERLTRPGAGEAHVPESWSRDGVLAFSVAKDGQFSLHMLSLADGKTTPFGNVRSAEPINSVFSRDGRWIAYTSSPASGPVRSSNRGVFVQPFPATGTQYQVPHAPDELVFQPLWGPKGDELLYVPTAVSGRIAAVPLTTTGSSVTFGAKAVVPAVVTGLRGSGATRAFDVLPDGRFIGIMQLSETTESAAQIRVVLNWFEDLRARVPGK